MKTKVFTVNMDDTDKNKTTECQVRMPSVADQKEANKVYNQAFTDALKAKAVVRAKLDDLLMDQGLWDATKQAEFNRLQSEILENERKLAKGGIALSEAKRLALAMREARDKIRSLISVKTNLDTYTAEGQADNARFNYLVSACTVYNNTNNKVFSSLENYLERSTEQVAVLAAQNLANLMFSLDNDYESTLPENKFLKQYKFVDDKLRLINKEGKLVDVDGRLIDESGRFIDGEGNYVDKLGNRVDEQGDYIVEALPFLDDDGKPIKPEEKKDEETKPTVSETKTQQSSSS